MLTSNKLNSMLHQFYEISRSRWHGNSLWLAMPPLEPFSMCMKYLQHSRGLKIHVSEICSVQQDAIGLSSIKLQMSVSSVNVIES